MRLFAQRPLKSSPVRMLMWYARAAYARVLFNRAIRTLAKTRHVRPLFEWVHDEQFVAMDSVDALRQHHAAIQELPYPEAVRDALSAMLLYRRLHWAVWHGEAGYAHDVRELLSLYPAHERDQGRMLHVLTTGIIMGALPPADVDFLREVALREPACLSADVVLAVAKSIRAKPEQPSAA